MKNKNLLLAIICLAWSLNNLQAQCFQKNSIYLDLGFGFAVYNTQYSSINNAIILNDHAASIIVPLSFEYGIGNRIGIGAKLISNNYFTAIDSLTKTKPKASSSEFAIFGNFHFLRTEHIDFYGGITLAASSFKYDRNDFLNTTVSGGGSMSDLHFESRFMFGRRLGLLASLRFAQFNYANIDYKNDFDTFKMNLTGGGMAIGTGISYHF
ncbi:MAG: hypothetical protein WCL14_01325 [Bacteroidota bacterium]